MPQLKELCHSSTHGNFLPTKMKFLALIICITFLFTRCRTRNINDLQGSWHLDSVYSFYNGFDMTSPGQEPLYHFQQDGRLRMTQDNEFRFFLYTVQGDSLTYTSLDDKPIDGLLILTLNDQQLVLKKEKAPLFKGDKQERYEIKYFSKVKN
jgi:hypothetical protein